MEQILGFFQEGKFFMLFEIKNLGFRRKGEITYALLFGVLGDSFRGGVGGWGGSQKRICKFENPVIRPVFHR